MGTNTKSVNDIPLNGLLRLSQVLKLIPVSKSHWWAGCRSGRYPQPIHLSTRITVWRGSDIQLLIMQPGNSIDNELGAQSNEKPPP